MDDDADVVELFPQTFVHVEGIAGHARVFHVEANEIRLLARMSEQLSDILVTKLLVELHAHMTELDVDVAVELLGENGVEYLFVLSNRGLGFLSLGNELAEDADGTEEALGVDPGHGADHVIEGLAGEVGACEVAHDRLWCNRKRSCYQTIEEIHLLPSAKDEVAER